MKNTSLFELAQELAHQKKKAKIRDAALKKDRNMKAEEIARQTLAEFLGIEIKDVICREWGPDIYIVTIPINEQFSLISYPAAYISETRTDLRSIWWRIVVRDEELYSRTSLKKSLALIGHLTAND